MNIKILNQKDGSFEIETADGTITLMPKSEDFSVGDELSIKDLILNIWSNAKIKDSNLVLEITN